MIPPICHICGKRFGSGGKLVYFKETPEDAKNNKRFETPGFAGHPSNAFWFCNEHSEAASVYKEFTKDVALPLIRKFYDVE